MKMFVFGPDGLEGDGEEIPKEILDLMNRIREDMVDGEMKTPREENHGWWNCKDCRELQHIHNLERVKEGMFTDESDNYFTVEYLKDMAKFYEDKMGDDTCDSNLNVILVIMSTINKWEKAVKDGAEIPKSKFY